MTRDCDLCRLAGRITPATHDAKTKMGPWAYLCGEHMKTHAHPGYIEAATDLAKVKL